MRRKTIRRSLSDGRSRLETKICRRKKAVEAFEKSEAFLATIFDSILDPFCIIDRDYRIVRANEAYAKMKGKGLAELLGKACSEAFCRHDVSCVDCIVRKTFETGDPCAQERIASLPDRITGWSAVHTYPIVDSEGNVTHVIEYTRDVTERKRAEEALRESEERYALAARGANDGLWDWDLRANRIYLSVRWKSMLGYGENMIGDDPQDWFGRIHPDDRAEVKARVEGHLNGRDRHFESEHRILHRDGTYRWVLNRGLAVRDAEGLAYRMAGSQTDITARKSAEDQLVHDAFHDALTGLPNRALFMDRLQHVITGARRRADGRYAVLFLDLDRFKIINDSLGHLVGDQLLIDVGRRLSECLRPGDTIARLGGDEFAVLLEDIGDVNEAVDIADRIHTNLAKSILVMGHEVFTSVSIGIAAGSERHERPEQVLRDADIAMYQAKAKGNARSEIFEAAMHATIIDRLQLEADMRGVLERRELLLFYQPIIDLKTRNLKGFEALVRWNHPTRGLLLPLEFVPLSEENGMIHVIGEWVIRESCRELRVLQERYPSPNPLTMSINISPRQFARPGLADRMTDILAETGINARHLVIEITESMIMENVDIAVATMQRLRDMGVRIHIDDFGTGHSSLSYLLRFPIDALKIDRTFINKLSADGANKNVVQSIISLANSLKFDVIAEGVEMDHQLLNIQELNCQYGQGFLFSKPMAAGDIDAWVKTAKLPV